MTDEQKEDFLDSVQYFYLYGGGLDRLEGFTIEKLEECDYALAEAYRRYKSAEETLSILINRI